MKSTKELILFFFLLVSGNQILLAQNNVKFPESYDVVWNSQSKNSSESMPCGGGSIGLNVWVENNELLLYISKSDAFEENNALNKLGRLRVVISPNPFIDAEFKQELILNDGNVKVSSSKGDEKTELNVWIDVFRPVIHIDMESSVARTVTATYENWRTETYKERAGENFQNSYRWTSFDIYTYKDSISFLDDNVFFFHRNNEATVFDVNVKLQGLDNVKEQFFNPIKNNTYGGLLFGEKMIPSGNTHGKYVDADYKGWSLKSKNPVRKQSIELCLFTKQTAKLDEWKNGLLQVVSESKANSKMARQKTLDWWHQYWNRSHIFIDPDKSKNNSEQWQVGHNYQLFR